MSTRRLTYALELVTGAAWLYTACYPAASPEPPMRARARAAVIAAAEGLNAADATCGLVSTVRKDLPLGERCVTAYKRGRASLMAAEALLDASEERSAVCAAGPGFAALGELLGELKATGENIPNLVIDGVALGEELARLAPCARDGGAP